MADANADQVVVGLVRNARGTAFRCGTCQYFRNGDGACLNKNPKLYKRHVDAYWCCNLYDHDGMKTIVK